MPVTCADGICGNSADIRRLAKADSAVLLVLSDIHHQPYPAGLLIKQYAPQCDAVVFCGDCAQAVSEMAFTAPDVFAAMPPVMAVVRGNCDGAAVSVPGGCIALPLHTVLTAAAHRILVTHGHLLYSGCSYEPLYAAAADNNCGTVFFGHTHIPANETLRTVQFVNPGSTAVPRGNSAASAALVTVTAKKSPCAVRFLPL